MCVWLHGKRIGQKKLYMLNHKMQHFKNCKAIYKRISKGELLKKKIKFEWSLFVLGFQDFEWRRLVYEWVRKKDRWLNIYHLNRIIWASVLLVALEKEDGTYIEWYWPERQHHEDLMDMLRSQLKEWEDMSKFLFTKIKTKW